MSQLFFIGVALVLIFEGMLPFLSPRLWRQTMQQMMTRSDHVLHLFGLVCMVSGVILLYIVH
jgi:uncharacterized protein YjeT (DUF2065 family)